MGSVNLYNYEKENIAQRSDVAVTYRIDMPSGWQIESVRTADNATVNPVNGSYTMPESEELLAHTVTLRYTLADQSQEAAVSVSSLSPYQKTMSATFETTSLRRPTFEVSDYGSAVCLTINANAYTGNIRVKWPQALVSPDNANAGVDMSAWLNANADAGEVFAAQANHIYTLLFVKARDSANPSFTVEEER